MTKQISRKGRRMFALLLVVAIMFTTIPMNAIAVTTNSDGYIEVSTIEDLYNIRNDLTANYILTNDIDLTEATAEGGDWDFMGNGWNPIGSNDVYGNEAYTGVFDGNGYSIIGMRIDVNTLPSGTCNVYLGLFANVTGVIKNLTLVGGSISYIESRVTKDFYIGAVAAYTTGNIDNCSNSAVLEGQATNNRIEGYVGGIAGYSKSEAEIYKCSNSGNVKSCNVTSGASGSNVTYDCNAAGGVIGYADSSVRISKCYNIGNIIAQAVHAWDGSMGVYRNGVAYASGIAYGATITDSYNAGIVTAYNNNGYALNAYGIGGTATCCYNVGESTKYAISDKTSINCYYLNGTGITSNGATSLTESQMRIQSMFKGFDFENVWTLNKYANHPYPQLRDNIQDMSESASLVSIIKLPEKTEYMTGDKLDFTGAMVKVIYVSGREEIIDITDDMVSGFDMDIAGEQSVTVTVAGASDTYIINVIERPQVESIVIISEPDVKVFAVGTVFNFAGAKAQVSYIGGITEIVDITPDLTTNGDINHIGKQTIIYAFGGKSATFDVEVVGISLDKIVLTELPSKLEYLEGQELDLSGMTVTAVMNNGFESTVATGYTVSGYSSEPGDYTVTVTYLEKTATFDVTVLKRSIVSLTVNTLPDKLEYISGQEFDDRGMQVIAEYDNGDVIVAENYTVSGFDSAPGIKNVVVAVDGESVSFPVKVIARVITEFKLTSLPSKLEYIEYDSFDITGLKVQATYNDGKTEEITDYELVGFSSEVGAHTISVAYAGFVESFDINVSARVLEDVKIEAPDKIAYYLGEKFDSTGMVVTAIYNNGQEIIVDDYQMVGFDSATPGAKTITVIYSGITRNFAVAVQERSVIETGGNMIVGNIVGRLGDTVVVDVSATKNTGIAGFRHTISYDATALEYVSVTAAGAYADGTLIVNDENAANGEITVLWYGVADVREDGNVYDLTFKVLDTATDGKAEISIFFEDNDNGNLSGENVLFGIIDGYVEVRSYWLGDLDGDRQYAMVDLLQLAQYVSGKEMALTDKQKLYADVNEDGNIDIHDVIMLNQWLLVADM